MKTKRNPVKQDFVTATSHLPRKARTFALQMAMDQAKREEVGERLKNLRRPPRPQQAIADGVGVSLRAYQAWEAGDSGITWEHLEALADFHDTTISLILDGDTEAEENTDDQLNRIQDTLHTIEVRQLETLDRLNILLGEQQAATGGHPQPPSERAAAGASQDDPGPVVLGDQDAPPTPGIPPQDETDEGPDDEQDAG